MAGVAYIGLIPIQELTAAQIANTRNSVINSLVDLVSHELTLSPDKLVVRDIRPEADLQLNTHATEENWLVDATLTVDYQNVTGAQTMADQRWIAIFGVRGLTFNTPGTGAGVSTATGAAYPTDTSYAKLASLIRISVGGSEKVIWDTSCLDAYRDAQVAFSQSAVIIPQNASYQIEYCKLITTAVDCLYSIQLIGVVVEPRGKVISP